MHDVMSGFSAHFVSSSQSSVVLLSTSAPLYTRMVQLTSICLFFLLANGSVKTFRCIRAEIDEVYGGLPELFLTAPRACKFGTRETPNKSGILLFEA